MISQKIIVKSHQSGLQNIPHHISTLYMHFCIIVEFTLGENLTFTTFGLRMYAKTIKN